MWSLFFQIFSFHVLFISCTSLSFFDPIVWGCWGVKICIFNIASPFISFILFKGCAPFFPFFPNFVQFCHFGFVYARVKFSEFLFHGKFSTILLSWKVVALAVNHLYWNLISWFHTCATLSFKGKNYFLTDFLTDICLLISLMSQHLLNFEFWPDIP